MRPELTEAQLLSVWETGDGQAPPARALLLAAAAAAPGEAVADLTLADLNALLLDLREGSFGAALPCAADCPNCDEPLEVSVTTDELRAPGRRNVPGPRRDPATLLAEGYEVTYRALTGGDLLSVDPASPEARRTLLSRCVVDTTPAADDLPEGVLETVAQRLADLDPGADTVVPLTCPYCRHAWTAALDVADYLWAEVEGYARRLLHEVHTLASVYGWSESEVLAVSPARRRFYLAATAV
ncbi:hypothetical protein [Streptomyces sp. AcE210]|uniref:hypothetical protein n=1 Tax=Streptomyces sp. AcE210 TaxID=2292703 RepID=UPI000E30B026|nr:hypothetical protein [Streptomyces sp. AcE210]RFC71010.1 hypothetical protein DXZ75_27895 [Streptomyces sp. AcE210]